MMALLTVGLLVFAFLHARSAVRDEGLSRQARAAKVIVVLTPVVMASIVLGVVVVFGRIFTFPPGGSG